MLSENELIKLKNNAIALVLEAESADELNQLYLRVLGKKGELNSAIKDLKTLPADQRARLGTVINDVKQALEDVFADRRGGLDRQTAPHTDVDVTIPGIRPPEGHLHIVTQVVMEITRIFERIGFTRVRHPEVDWDWYAFQSLNMPPDHPARDEWETFFIDYRPPTDEHRKTKNTTDRASHVDSRRSKIVLTPHTSNGQVREMEKGKLPIRMINIAKCYRRQIDVSHTPMFHQFEGLYIDRNVSIIHLKGVIDYFAKAFYGPGRNIRLRPFHFQFTEPSFEIDVSCGICGRHGCRLCKEGWLELGGAGMVHPNVLKAGKVDTKTYNGFAFGWGVERTYMMKSGTRLDDIRLLYSNDIRFLEQF